MKQIWHEIQTEVYDCQGHLYCLQYETVFGFHMLLFDYCRYLVGKYVLGGTVYE
jgi:hypothetical protein